MINNTTAKQTSIINNNDDNNITVDDSLNIFRIWVGLSGYESTHKVIIDNYNNYTPRARGYKVAYTDAFRDAIINAIFI